MLLINGVFAYFSWIDLSDTDSNNWVGTSSVDSILLILLKMFILV